MSTGSSFLRRLFIAEDQTQATPSPSVDIDALLRDTLNPSSQSVSSASASATLPVSASGDPDLVVPEGVDLSLIYTEANVPAVPFSIEKLAKLIEGLNQLDAATKKTAVAAMDAADEGWDIASVIADGTVKRAALTSYLSDISSVEQAVGAEITRRLDLNQADKASRLASIDEQIAALNAQREEAIAATANVSATLRAQGAAAAEAGERERTRIAHAIRGFDGLIALFDSATPLPAA